jgi:hypothetical protein
MKTKVNVDREYIMSISCTLDKVPAQVKGKKLDFALVIDSNNRSFNWSWETLAMIANKTQRLDLKS